MPTPKRDPSSSSRAVEGAPYTPLCLVEGYIYMQREPVSRGRRRRNTSVDVSSVITSVSTVPPGWIMGLARYS